MSLDILIVAVYLAAVLFVGFSAAGKRKRGVEDYVLAGRSLTLPLFVATLVTSFYGGVFGVGEFTFRNGLSNWLVMGAPYYLFGIIYAFYFAGKVRVTPGLTLPDHLEGVYGKRMALFGALLLFIMMSPADEILMFGTLLGWATGLAKDQSLFIATILAVAIIYRGGLRSGVWTNVLELGVMFGGFFLILPFAFFKLGGTAYLKASLPALHLTVTGGKPVAYLLTWYFIAFWTLIDPTFHQRVSAAKDPETAKKGILLSVAFWCVFDFMTTSAGLYARAALPDLKEPMLAYPMLAEQLLPPVVKGLFLAGMMSSMLAAMDSAVLVSAVLLARDMLARAFGGRENEQEDWLNWAVPVTGLAGLSLAMLIPSVVELWYAVGSTVNPALLLPVVSIYVPALRVPKPWALASSTLGWLLATGWFIVTQVHSAPPFGIEPMYPGFALAALLWSAGLLSRRKTA